MISLEDYIDDHAFVVVFWVGVGQPNVAYVCHSTDDFLKRNELLDLVGFVDDHGDWRWDGEGGPTDDRANTIYKIHAYPDEKRFQELLPD